MKNTITTKCNNVAKKLRQKEQAALLKKEQELRQQEQAALFQKEQELRSKTQATLAKKQIANPRKKK